MKTIKTFIYIAVLLVAATFVSFVNNTKNDDLDEEFLYMNDTCNNDSGPELFCNYMSSEDWPQETFFADMVEVYNTAVILNGMKSVLDVWKRIESSEDALQSLQCIDLNKIASEDLRIMFSNCLETGRQLFSKDFDDFDDTAFIRFNDSIYYLDSTLATRYNVDNYANLSIDDYWRKLDFAEQSQDLFGHLDIEAIHEGDIDNLMAEKDIALILEEIENETDFDKKCAYAMQYIYFVGFYNADMNVVEGLLDDGRYSPYLFFLWRIWRCGVQLRNYGGSTWSSIPNKMYNEKRHMVAETTLRHIANHRDDAMAINHYLVISTYPNIMRFGYFLAGNESFTELIDLDLAY